MSRFLIPEGSKIIFTRNFPSVLSKFAWLDGHFNLTHLPLSMDSRVAILGANGTGKSTLLHLITDALQPCEGTISKHSALKLAKYSQHSADQLPYDSSPIEYFQTLFSQKYPEKDIMVSELFVQPPSK